MRLGRIQIRPQYRLSRMDANPSGQKTHNGAVLRSATRRHDLANAGRDRIVPIPAIAPSAMILILAMIVVG
jgi:hypothetical protein